MKNLQILRLPEVIARTGISRSSVYAKEAAGTFPKHIELGPRCSGWLAHEVDEWISQRVSESRQKKAV